MLDTLGLESPPISEEFARAIERQLTTKSAVDNGTGELLYEITSGSLLGSFDHRISCRVARDRVVPMSKRPGERVQCTLVRCEPFLLCEGSVHKALLGHNVWGGPLDVGLSVRAFVGCLEKSLGMSLPLADEWLIYRADWAEIFELGSTAACMDYLRGLGFARYPRRGQPRNDYGETLTWSGTTTSAKLYCKGPEFWAHDYKRLRGRMPHGECEALAQKANGVLRCEVTVKRNKLKADMGGSLPTSAKVTSSYLERAWQIDFFRIVREGCEDMTIVRNNVDVKRRLVTLYGGRLGTLLYSTYVSLATTPEDEVKMQMALPTFYRHRKALQEAGISWHGTNVHVTPVNVPAGFQVSLGSAWRSREVAPAVVSALAAYAA